MKVMQGISRLYTVVMAQPKNAQDRGEPTKSKDGQDKLPGTST